MKKLQIKPELLTEDQRDKLESYQAQQKQLTVLQDIADMTQDMLMGSDKEKKFTQKAVEDMGSLLVDMREALNDLKDKKAPEAPDYSKPVVEAVAKLEKALAAVEVKPSVTVSTPEVKVPPVDLKEFNQLLRTEIPKAFTEAVKSFPKVDIPPVDNTELLAAWEGISEQLLSIETATRLKPLPGSMAISNLEEVTTAITNVTEYASRVDTTTTTNMIYIGSAAIASSESDPVWQISRIDTSTIAADTKWADGNSSFDNTWSGRAGKTYL